MSESRKTATRGARLQQKKDALSIQPSELVFQEAEVGKIYEMEINIRNKTPNIQHLKIYKPKYEVFELDYETQAESLSSGLSKKVKVRFAPTDAKDYYDKIKVVDHLNTYEIPLRAHAKKNQMKYEETLEAGIIGLNDNKVFRQIFVNNGPATRVKLIKDNFENLFISPDQFFIGQGNSQKVEMYVVPTVAGTYKHRVLVEYNGTMGAPINLVYSAIQFRFYLTTQQGKKISELDFGNIYFGEKKVVKILAVNNTPQYIDIKSKIRLGWKFNQSTLESPQELGIECSSTIIDVESKDCKMEPFSKQSLTLACKYEVDTQIQSKVCNFAKRQEMGVNKFIGSVSTEIIQKYKMNSYQTHETLIAQFRDKKLYCSLKATCVYPLIKIQPSSLFFGDIFIKSTLMKKIAIRNVRDNLPIKVNFSKTFSFEVIPSDAIILPNQQQIFQVFLTPVSIGNFNSFLSCSIMGHYKIDIPVSYRSISKVKNNSSSLYLSASHKLQEETSLADISNLSKTLSKLQDRKVMKSGGKSCYTSAGERKGSILRSNCNNKFQKQQGGEPIRETLALGKNKDNIFQDNSQSQDKILLSNRYYSIPKKKQGLFVTRKIDKYQPYKKLVNKLHPETRELSTACKKMPKSRKEFAALRSELPVQALKNIEVTDKILNFGKVFVHSKMVKQFQIVNNNDFSIQVKLTSNHEFLSESDSHYQIIPGKTRCKFSVVLLPKQCGEFQSLVEYQINSVHLFKFLVQAEVELVTLNISKFNLKMNYQDDLNDMYLSDVFDLANEGNTEAYFSIQYNSDLFSIEPKNGILKSGDKNQIKVVYKNQNSEIMAAGEPKNIKDYNKPTTHVVDERIIVKVRNGVDIFLRVQSSIFEPKCYVKESKINFGICIVPKSKSKTFILRNLNRSICLYEIDNSNCENFLQFDALKGKVLPESSKEVIVTYKSITVHEVNMSFKVLIRGGPIISVPFTAESIAPQVNILEDEFNFGEVCCGNVGSLPIHIRNDSETVVELLLDLLNHHVSGCEFLDFSFESEKEDKMGASKNKIQHVVHKLRIDAKSTSRFLLLFRPKSPGFYEFQLPIYIQNFIKNDSMAKTVSCFAKKPKFFLEPAIVKFKKKVINQKDNTCFHPLVEFVTLKNPSDNVLKWKIQMPKQEGCKKLCFQIQNRRGEVKSKSWQCINIAFNPYEAGYYTYTFPVFIYSWEKGEYIQQAEIKVQGEGQYPLLVFDRRELILPVVPLHVESVGMFKIINQGYETIDIKHRIYSLEDLNLIPEIILFYPQGSKMGINKKQLYVIVKFVAKKPVSFTVKLEIYDGCRIYDLPISGTSDNSLFTIFPYLTDKENLYKLENASDSVNLRSVDSRNIIDKLHNQYEQLTEADYHLTCEVIRRWINTLLKDQKVMRFPEDLVTDNDNLLKFLAKLTSKKELQKLSSEADSQQKFYQSVIRTLKSMGCLLNHIRPYYLLGEEQFSAIFEDPALKHMASTYKKYYRVIHLECWIILFYQAVSNFWYNPQKLKHADIKSNVYTNTEVAVLKWVKGIYSQYNEPDDLHKFVDYGRDFKDCFALIYALHHYNYLNKSQQSLEGLNRRIVSASDYSTNLRMLYTMMAKASLIPLISEDQFQFIKETQMFMLLYQLYESLPQQIPKTAPIIFSCQLGERCTKFIQIKNPSSKTVNYWVRVEGSQDYFLEEKQFIKIQPKSTYKLSVEFRSRVSQEEVAFLTLFNKKELESNSGIGCSLVFELRSQIVGRKSIKKLQSLKCPLYENTSIKVAVENQFNDKEYGNFKIIIVQEFLDSKQQTKSFNFYVEIESIKIRRGTSNIIDLYYNPMILKPIRCLLIFCDPAVGEFQYEIIGVPEVPKPLQQIKVPNPIYINTIESVELGLPVYNNFMIKSQSLMDQKWELLKNTNRLNRSLETAKKIGDLDKEELPFKVEVNMDPKILQYIKIDSELTLFSRNKAKADLRNRLKIQCNFNIIIKDLVLDFVLVSYDKRDVRRFKAQINVTSQPIFSQINLKTNARTPLVQQIPIENTTLKDWKVSCVISDLEDNQFSLKDNELVLQRQYTCKKQSKITCLFVFSPEWVGESTCKLTITNLITNQQIVYSIKGISEEPLSDDHVYFSTFTGKSGLHSIPIRNPYPEKLTYRVLSDLTEINCSPEVTIEANEKMNFNFILAVNTPGVFIGFIKFIDKMGRFFWYSITIEAEDQVVYEEKIKFESLIDREVEKVLEFKNALTKTSSYKVDFQSVFLQGQKAFDVKPYSSYLYRLRFKPTVAINEETSVRIFCPEKGAHIYRVQMISHEHYKRELPPLKVEVGRVGCQEVKLSEPDHSKTNLKYEISNPNFHLQYEEPKGNSELLVKVCYKPMEEGSQKCTIKLTYGFNLIKMYEIEGIGIAPFTVQAVEFSAIDLQPVLEIIKFKNPYQKTDQKKIRNEKFSVMIEANEMKVYNFVGYGEEWEAEVTDILAIPVQFRPKQEGYYESMLTVQADIYKWQYLLKGSSVSQINPSYYDEEIICKTREEGIKVLKMQIPDFLKNQNLKPNKISLHHAKPHIISMVRPWLKLKIQMNNVDEQGLSTVYVRFKPKKPINDIITLSLYSHLQESVKMNKKIKLLSHPPAPEEKISIQINSIKKHMFKIPISSAIINNLGICQARMEKSQYFQSKIEGQNISLTFKPNNCTFKSNFYKDLLIVESEQDYWSFEVEIQLIDIMKKGKKNIVSK